MARRLPGGIFIKAPGLALATLPWYGALRTVGLQSAPPDTDLGYTRACGS